VKNDKRFTITTLWTKFFYEYLLEDEQELSVFMSLMKSLPMVARTEVLRGTPPRIEA
jgi:hypothetical protein